MKRVNLHLDSRHAQMLRQMSAFFGASQTAVLRDALAHYYRDVYTDMYETYVQFRDDDCND